jgi:hypothetical protein
MRSLSVSRGRHESGRARFDSGKLELAALFFVTGSVERLRNRPMKPVTVGVTRRTIARA